MASHTHLRQTHAAGTDGTAAKSTVIIRKPGPGSDCSYCPARRVYGWALQSSTLAAAQPEVRVQPTHPASTLSQRRACTLTSSLSTLGAPAPPLRPTATAARRGSQTRGSCRCSRPPGSPAHASRSSAVLLSVADNRLFISYAWVRQRARALSAFPALQHAALVIVSTPAQPHAQRRLTLARCVALDDQA